MHRLVRHALLLAAALVGVGSAAVRAEAAELVMFDAEWCAFCKRFHREVGATYAESDVARVFPLRVIDIDRQQPDFETRERVRATPTFVFVENGREIGRFSGYTSPERFYDTMRQAVEALRRARQRAPVGGDGDGEAI